MDIQQRVLELIAQDENSTKTESLSRQNDDGMLETVKQIVNAEYEKSLIEQAENEEIQQATKQVTERKLKAELVKDMLEVMNEEQKNELAQYYLDCEKKTLAYRRKKEKKIIIEEVSAELQKRKFNALWLRYGYMYKDEKSFVPNKVHNIGKEIANWWNGLSGNIKRVVKAIITIMLWLTIFYLFIKYGRQVLQVLPDITTVSV